MLSGCQFRESGKINCKTETEVKTVCDSEGGGVEVTPIFGRAKEMDE